MRRALLSLFAFSALLAPVAAQAGMTDAQKKEIEAIVRQYILDNPEVLFEAADKHQQKQEEAAAEAAKKVLAEKSDELFKNPAYAVLGNPKAAVAFVEFFDYNCGYCKQAYKDLNALVERNKDIKIILVDTPILGPTSLEAAKWAIAAGKQGKYTEFHKAAMSFTGPKNEESLRAIAKDAGLDPDKVKEAAAKEEVMTQISKNMQLFSSLGLSGTPGFAAKDQVLRGFVGSETLEKMAKEMQTAANGK